MTVNQEQRDRRIADVLIALRSWAVRPEVGGAWDAYVFGTLVQDQGRQFRGNSDIDMILVLKETLGAARRVEALRGVHATLLHLERDLLAALKRVIARPICSISPITQAERALDLLKKEDKHLLSVCKFVPLSGPAETVAITTNPVDPEAINQNAEIIEVARMTQAVRNQYLRMSANGSTPAASHTKSDPLPKSLARIAAIVRARVGPAQPEAQREDCIIGTAYALQVVTECANHPDIDELRDVLQRRIARRGVVPELTVFHQMLLLEVLSDAAWPTFVPSPGMRVRGFLADLHSKRQG